MTVIMIIGFSLVLSWLVNFNWWHLIKPTKFVSPCLVAQDIHYSLDRHRHYQSTESNSGSFVVFCETCPKGKTIFSTCNRDGYIAKRSFCTLQKGLALQALHAHHWAGCLWTCAVREHVLHIRKCLPWLQFHSYQQQETNGQCTTVHAERSPLYSNVTDPKDLFYFPTETPSEHRWIINSW